jgi:hypothetical protein
LPIVTSSNVIINEDYVWYLAANEILAKTGSFNSYVNTPRPAKKRLASILPTFREISAHFSPHTTHYTQQPNKELSTTMARSRNLNTASRCRRLASANTRLREEEATHNLELSLFGDDVLADLPPINNPTNFDVAFPPDAVAATTTTANNNPPPAVTNPAVAPQEEVEPVHIIPLLVVLFHKLVHVNISRLTPPITVLHRRNSLQKIHILRIAIRLVPKRHAANYHLEGGILAYLDYVAQKKSDNQTNHGNDVGKETTQSTFKGECFVFDKRIAVTEGCKPSKKYIP